MRYYLDLQELGMRYYYNYFYTVLKSIFCITFVLFYLKYICWFTESVDTEFTYLFFNKEGSTSLIMILLSTLSVTCL